MDGMMCTKYSWILRFVWMCLLEGEFDWNDKYIKVVG